MTPGDVGSGFFMLSIAASGLGLTFSRKPSVRWSCFVMILINLFTMLWIVHTRKPEICDSTPRLQRDGSYVIDCIAPGETVVIPVPLPVYRTEPADERSL